MDDYNGSGLPGVGGRFGAQPADDGSREQQQHRHAH